MSFDYASLAADALALVAEFGVSTTLTTITAAAYDPATGTTTPTEAAQTVSAVVFPYGDKAIDGTLIQAGDRQAFISAAALTEPKPGDVLTWESASWRVERVKTISPAGTIVLCECQIRR